MNIPSTIGGGNWAWRMEEGAYDKKLAKKLKKLAKLYFRYEKPKKAEEAESEAELTDSSAKNSDSGEILEPKAESEESKEELFFDDTPVDVSTFPSNTMTDEEFEEYRKKIREENSKLANI